MYAIHIFFFGLSEPLVATTTQKKKMKKIGKIWRERKGEKEEEEKCNQVIVETLSRFLLALKMSW